MRKSAVAIMLLVASAAFYLASPVRDGDVRTAAPQATDNVPGKVLSKTQAPARSQTALLAMESLGSGDKR
jgi:hypothetical protein